MIQLYAKLEDITPTEDKWTNPVPDEMMADPEEAGHFKYTDWLEDIKKNGIKYALKIHPNGLIADGNFRYWCAKELGMTHVPVDIWWFMGIQKNQYMMSIRSDLPIPSALDFKAPISKFKHAPVVLGHGTHSFCGINNIKWIGLK